MHHFKYQQGILCAEGVPLPEIARAAGTPTYVYSRATLTRHFRAFDSPLSEIPHLVCCSVKACDSLAVLNLLAGLGAGFDIVSGGELFRCLRAGGDPGKIVYSGVGKTEAEIRAALGHGIFMFNVESEQELVKLNEVAGAMGKRAAISLRINPEVDAQTHPYISTGLRQNKFGIDLRKSLELYQQCRQFPHLEVVGVDCHIGSQLTQTAPIIEALIKLVELIAHLRSLGFSIRYLDLGGGLGITYDREEPPLPEEYARDILAAAKDLECTLVFEPGRVIVGNAAVLLTRVLYTKETDEKNFIIVDAGMNDCIRPSLYGAYHQIWPIEQKPVDRDYVADVVGPICESGDYLAQDRAMPRVQPGELLALMSAGAYCMSMASNYNARPRPAEVMVGGSEFQVIRRRETYEDLVRNETIPSFNSD